MPPWVISGLLIIGGVFVAFVGAVLTLASSRAKATQGGPLARQDFAMVVIAIGVVATVFGMGLLFFRLTRPF